MAFNKSLDGIKKQLGMKIVTEVKLDVNKIQKKDEYISVALKELGIHELVAIIEAFKTRAKELKVEIDPKEIYIDGDEQMIKAPIK